MRLPLIWIDSRAPAEALQNLQPWGTVVEFATQGIVYDTISGHPDIFMYQWPGGLVLAPDLPEHYLQKLLHTGVSVKVGESKLGKSYPQTAHYNACYTSYGILHNKNISDNAIKETHSHFIHCAQGYARCNALEVAGCIITSDRGIHKTLTERRIPCFFADPGSVKLHGVKHGFFPGCCGYFNHTLFVCGSLDSLKDAPLLRQQLLERGVEIVEIFSGPLIDVGGIFFI